MKKDIFFFFGHIFLIFLGEYLGEKPGCVKQMKNMMYALVKALSDGSGYNLSYWFDFLFALDISKHYIALRWHCIVLLISRGTGSSSYKAKQFDLSVRQLHIAPRGPMNKHKGKCARNEQLNMEKANLYQPSQWGKVWTNGKSQARVRFEFLEPRGRWLEKKCEVFHWRIGRYGGKCGQD